MSAVNELDAHAIVGRSAPDYAFSFEPSPHRVRAVVGQWIRLSANDLPQVHKHP